MPDTPEQLAEQAAAAALTEDLALLTRLKADVDTLRGMSAERRLALFLALRKDGRDAMQTLHELGRALHDAGWSFQRD